jgi:hypothetical protein
MTEFEVRDSDHVFKYGEESKREGYNRKTFRVKPPDMIDRKVIAWDMEGISLSGQEKPQHPVLFGCSEYVDTPLEGVRLTMREMLEYIIEVGENNPHSIHVGYAFRYDANDGGKMDTCVSRSMRSGRGSSSGCRAKCSPYRGGKQAVGATRGRRCP